MANNRIARINEEIQKELSALLRSVKDPRVSSCMATIIRVDTSSDLRYSRISISALDKSREAELMQGLKSAAGYLRRELGSRMKLRYTPELQFVADDSIAYGAHILDLLNHVKPANPENEALSSDGENEGGTHDDHR
jgi:ribosome-binding factor A